MTKPSQNPPPGCRSCEALHELGGITGDGPSWAQNAFILHLVLDHGVGKKFGIMKDIEAVSKKFWKGLKAEATSRGGSP